MRMWIGLALFLRMCCPAAADEGMWLFNAPPRERLKQDYGFELTDAWLGRVMRSAVRFNNGGSGAFVSPRGLVVTNHHIGADSMQKLSSPGRDLVEEGYYASTATEELKCPDLELDVLQSVEDVTAAVQAAVRPSMTAEQAAAARRAVMAEIEKSSLDRTGLRSDVVTLYQGGAYHLYRFRKYTDVRLVMAPEHAVAFFGGDAHNFEYPRYNLDICFFRVYEDGKPVSSRDYLPWNPAGPAEGDLVFVVGNPGRTNRLDTLARLEHLRDLTLPLRLNRLYHEESLLQQYAQRGEESARQAQSELYGVANSRKAYEGQLQGLLNPAVIGRKRRLEAEFRQRLEGRPELAAFPAIERAQRALAAFEVEYSLFELGYATQGDLFSIARHLVRLAAERDKPSGERLREYRDSARESLELELFSPAPIAAELEQARLAGSMTFAAELLGGEHPLVRILLGEQPPGLRAAQLVQGTRLAEVAERKRLAGLSLAELKKSTDPLIQLAFALDGPTRALRARFESEVEEPERQAYAQIARARFELEAAEAPDATFSLRLAYGKVAGYQAEGRPVPWFTTFRGAFELSRQNHNREPYHLPERWLQGGLDLDRPFDFVSTADTIGGNSGSPVIDRQGRCVGVNFDRNRYGLVRNFVYTDVMARHIAVHSGAVVEALSKLYHADALVKELTGG